MILGWVVFGDYAYTTRIPLYAYFYTIFSLDQIDTMATLQDYRTIMVPLFPARKSSANHLAPRVFVQKGFAISILGHFFCPFPGNFFES
jgi:hypothetical protein